MYKYEALVSYLEENEMYEIANDVRNDRNVEFVKSFVEDTLNDSDTPDTLDPDTIVDMFKYHVDHN